MESKESNIIGLCRDTALGNYRWGDLLQDVCSWVGGEKAMMMSSGRYGPYHNALSFNHDPALLARYNADYNQADPRLPFSKLTKPGECRLGQQYLTNDEIKNTDYYNEITVKGDVLDSVHGVLLDDGEFGRQAISIQRSFRSDLFAAENLRRMKFIMPHLTEAIKYSVQIASHYDQTPRDALIGNCLIDMAHNVKQLDGNIPSILERYDGMSFTSGKLRCKSAVLKKAISMAIDNALRGKETNMRLRGSGPDHAQLRFSPQPGMLQWANVEQSHALLRISVQSENLKDLIDLYGNAFELSQAEQRILQAMMHHADNRGAAEALEVSYETLRWHLKNIYSKTGYSRREDLIESVRCSDLTNAL